MRRQIREGQRGNSAKKEGVAKDVMVDSYSTPIIKHGILASGARATGATFPPAANCLNLERRIKTPLKESHSDYRPRHEDSNGLCACENE